MPEYSIKKYSITFIEKNAWITSSPGEGEKGCSSLPFPNPLCSREIQFVAEGRRQDEVVKITESQVVRILHQDRASYVYFVLRVVDLLAVLLRGGSCNRENRIRVRCWRGEKKKTDYARWITRHDLRATGISRTSAFAIETKRKRRRRRKKMELNRKIEEKRRRKRGGEVKTPRVWWKGTPEKVGCRARESFSSFLPKDRRRGTRVV